MYWGGQVWIQYSICIPPGLTRAEWSPPSICWHCSPWRGAGGCLLPLTLTCSSGSWSAWCPLGIPGFFFKVSFKPSHPQPILASGDFPVQVQSFALLLDEFHEVSVALFFSLLKTFWVTAQPFGVSVILPSFESCANLLKVYSVPFSKWLMKMLKEISPSIDSWGTFYVKEMNLKFVKSSVELV